MKKFYTLENKASPGVLWVAANPMQRGGGAQITEMQARGVTNAAQARVFVNRADIRNFRKRVSPATNQFNIREFGTKARTVPPNGGYDVGGKWFPNRARARSYAATFPKGERPSVIPRAVM